jgi:hypothetical protein
MNNDEILLRLLTEKCYGVDSLKISSNIQLNNETFSFSTATRLGKEI